MQSDFNSNGSFVDTDSEEPSAPSPLKVLGVLGGFAAVVLTVIGGIVFFAVQAVNKYEAEQKQQLEAEKQLQEEQQKEYARQREEFIKQQEIARVAAAEKTAEQAAERTKQQLMTNEQRRLETIAAQKKMQAEREAERKRQLLEIQQRQEFQTALRNMQTIQSKFRSAISKRAPDEFLLPESVRNPQLSWRVHLLPTLGFQRVYDEFHLDEPWDSPHNKTMIEKMPTIYGALGADDKGMTRLRSLLTLDGNEDSLTRLGDITDGLGETALLIRVGKEHAIPWSQPDHTVLFEQLTPESLGLISDEATLFSILAHDQIKQTQKMHPMVLRAMCSPAGGEHLGHELFTSHTNGDAIANWQPHAAAATNDSRATLTDEELHQTAVTKLSKIGNAMNEYIQDRTTDTQVKQSQLSWRVLLLPYLGEKDLYDRFNLTEPWNSPVNIALVNQMPEVYQLDGTPGRCRIALKLPTKCRRGPGGIPEPKAISDSLDLTTALYLAAPQKAESWTKPDNSAAYRLPLHFYLGWPKSSPVLAATLTGKTYLIPGDLHDTKLNALTSVDGGETFEFQDFIDHPDKTLRIVPVIKPATPITSLITLPEISRAAGAQLKSPEPEVTDTKLRKIAIAMNRYHDSYRKPPPQTSGLSWRVHILPLLDENVLYEKFHLNEPWDSEHNKSLLEFMPEVYQSFSGQSNTTSFRVFTGPQSVSYGYSSWFRAPDGHLNTIMLMKAGVENGVPWTKPDDNVIPESLSVKDFVSDGEDLIIVLGDGGFIKLPDDAPNDVFRALATAGGGEIIDPGTVRRWVAQRKGEYQVATLQTQKWLVHKMARVSMAMMNYHDTFMFYPPGMNQGSSKVMPLRQYMLSWRVHILPFIGHRALYKQFRLEEPWDSPHNLQLISAMPDVFRDRNAGVESSTTRLQVFTGKGTPFPEAGVGPSRRDIRDGAHATISFFLAPADRAVPWTQPIDFPIDAADNTPSPLESLVKDEGIVAMFDGSTRKIPPGTDAKTWKALISPNGRELVNMRELFGR